MWRGSEHEQRDAGAGGPAGDPTGEPPDVDQDGDGGSGAPAGPPVTAGAHPVSAPPSARRGRARWVPALRHRLVSALAPDESPAEPVVAGRLTEREALQVLDALVRMAEALLSCGAPAADVTALTLRAAHGAGLASTQVDITFTAVIVSTAAEDRPPLTTVRVVRARATDYSRLSRLYDLAHDAGDGLDAEEVTARLKRALSQRRRYRRRVSTAAAVGLAVSVAVLLGGGWAVALAAAATTALIQLVLAAANRRGLPAFFQQVAGAAIATAVALLLLVWDPFLPEWVGGLRPSLVVGSGIVVLLAGLSLVGSAEDAISGFYVTAAARAFETVLLTTGLVIGIAGALALGQRAGIGLNLSFAATGGYPLAVEAAAAGCAALTWAVSGYADVRAVVLSGLVGALAWLTFSATSELGFGPLAATGLAALVVGLLAEGTAWRWGVPGVVVSICGIVPLLPGLAIYRAIYTLVGGGTSAGLGLLVEALGTALALAAGVTLGEFCSQPLRREFDRVERLVRRRSLSRNF
ncbi:threonine/serine exporter family protein [Kineococcus sp. SYSU DK004]|uniref:threonine/serine ThrE exporter family protein n=1 Tax=Kineococcus sp. SYSU DK004 TaxID=3383125 RepID=UPI003D7C5396